MDEDAIVTGLAQVCGQLNAAHGRLVALVAEALTTECWVGVGIHTCAQWVAWQTGLSPARAAQIVEIARRRNELPVTYTALAAGELSVDQVAVIAHHTPAAFDTDVATFAQAATVSQLRRTLRSYSFADDEADPVEGFDPTQVTGRFDEAGRYRLQGVLEADDGAIVDAALREARDALYHTAGSDVTWGDALVEMARRSLATVTPLARRDLFVAYLHVPTDGPGAYLHHGVALPDTLARHLLCDTRGVVVGLHDGRPVDVGRTRRIVPAHTRRLIENRDRGCRVPGCGQRYGEIHHIIHWLDHGPTDASNLLSLCHRHHRLHHQGRLGIAGDADRPDGLTFTDSRGRPLPGAPPPTPPHPDHRLAVNGSWQHPTGERLEPHWIDFTPTPNH